MDFGHNAMEMKTNNARKKSVNEGATNISTNSINISMLHAKSGTPRSELHSSIRNMSLAWSNMTVEDR